MPEFDEETNTINTFGGSFVSATEDPEGELNFIFTRGGGDDPIQTLTVNITGIDAKDVTTSIT